MPFLIDTNVAIHLRDDDPAVVDRVERLADLPMLSIVSLVELENGVVAMPQFAAARRISLDDILRDIILLDFGVAEAAAFRTVVTRTGFSRQKTLDRMIAATALVHGLTLVTRNPRDFADIDGLAIESW